ncbi:hypothetical protein BURC_00171 [Burkholderiaceae bacterium]|nr:hypothetical protein BURC_00171 [Burkholderiaceae bacterium]
MAAVQRKLPDASRVGDACGLQLSGLERRCLHKHICESHELLQLTILGADAACDKAGSAVHLVRICQWLAAAESLIAQAEQLAALELMPPQDR